MGTPRTSTPPYPGAELPGDRSLPSLAEAVQRCRGCDLYRDATQAVFGSGSTRAQVMLVGEQPGDAEDKAGTPFVGPAGRMLDKALESAGVPRDRLWVTNAVKHFSFTPRGKRRIHKKPRPSQVRACRPWLEAEIADVQPRVVVCLGAVAAQSLLGTRFRLTQARGQLMESPWANRVLATWHPSSVLRADDPARTTLYQQIVDDLRVVATALRS